MKTDGWTSVQLQAVVAKRVSYNSRTISSSWPLLNQKPKWSGASRTKVARSVSTVSWSKIKYRLTGVAPGFRQSKGLTKRAPPEETSCTEASQACRCPAISTAELSSSLGCCRLSPALTLKHPEIDRCTTIEVNTGRRQVFCAGRCGLERTSRVLVVTHHAKFRSALHA